jgi:2-polyprenyl-6-methoxyphenol hydroxylase-like FAD-dependent oxidoreductase
VNRLEVECCIAGGGPAGLMLGVLLARGGVEVSVLEKHGDFLRDFRGDTVHPSTLDVLDDIGLGEAFARLPHSEVHQFIPPLPGASPLSLDGLPVRHPYIAFVPQWDLLDLLAAEGRRHPNFHLLMQTEVTGLIEEGGRVRGVRQRSPAGEGEVIAALTVGADGRHSTIREAARLELVSGSPPMDVLWFRLPRVETDGGAVFGAAAPGLIAVFLNRGDYWQVAYVIAKGTAEQLRSEGIDRLRQRVVELAPRFADRVCALESWDDARLLTVRSDRLRRWWRPGLLLIGDAAHAMSPIGGVGINLAVQDAVASANLLGPRLLSREPVTDADLAAVQRRREFPTRATQAGQDFLQRRVLAPVLGRRTSAGLGLLQALLRIGPLRRVAVRALVVGVRPEPLTWEAARV